MGNTAYYWRNREKILKQRKMRYQQESEQIKEKYRNAPEIRIKHRQAAKKAYQRLRLAVLDHYGGRICKDCGEKDLVVLTIDHLNGGGHKQRRQISPKGGGGGLYYWLKRNNYPVGYEVVCMNCNWRRRIRRMKADYIMNGD